MPDSGPILQQHGLILYLPEGRKREGYLAIFPKNW